MNGMCMSVHACVGVSRCARAAFIALVGDFVAPVRPASCRSGMPHALAFVVESKINELIPALAGSIFSRFFFVRV